VSLSFCFVIVEADAAVDLEVHSSNFIFVELDAVHAQIAFSCVRVFR